MEVPRIRRQHKARLGVGSVPYDAVLAKNPRQASAQLVRSYAKGRLGDQAGRDADLAAAKAAYAGIEARFVTFDGQLKTEGGAAMRRRFVRPWSSARS